MQTRDENKTTDLQKKWYLSYLFHFQNMFKINSRFEHILKFLMFKKLSKEDVHYHKNIKTEVMIWNSYTLVHPVHTLSHP